MLTSAGLVRFATGTGKSIKLYKQVRRTAVIVVLERSWTSITTSTVLHAAAGIKNILRMELAPYKFENVC